MQMTWQNLEEKVREIAQLRWDCSAVAETIDGVKCACVLRPSADQVVLIEITKECNLDKVRSDVLKLRGVRGYFFDNHDIYCKCYIVLEGKPTDSMRQYGEGRHVKVISFEEFQNEFFNYSSYVYVRKQRQFGSLINLITGMPEENEYVNVTYRNIKTGQDCSIDQIVKLLRAKKKIVLKGDFGLGKSRCIKQLFDQLSSDQINNPYVFAINLREYWGMKNGIEILRRHFDDLGLEAKNYIKGYDRPNAIYLLDGFDEIGSQAWNSDPKVMPQHRANSVQGIKDLIRKVQGGVLIAGREYYFNSDEEMCSSLGLNEDTVVILECHSEFGENELADFIQKNTSSKVDTEKLKELPGWLPKRPLVIQLLLKYAGDIFSVEYAMQDIYSFWSAFLTRICEREANINTSLNADIIKKVMLELANKTRTSKMNTGPISVSDMDEAFNTVAGHRPTGESMTMLQRLPTLGRISADTPDRQFLDAFILNGLRAEYIIQLSQSWKQKVLSEEWIYPLDQTGLSMLAAYIEQDISTISLFLDLARQASQQGNQVLACDIVAALCMLDCRELDFKDITLQHGCFSCLTFEGKCIKRLYIDDAIIELLDLTNSSLDDSVTIRGCDITKVCGIASDKTLASNTHFNDCTVRNVDKLSTATLIKNARFTNTQSAFVQILKMLFLQPGKGRRELTLYQGVGGRIEKSLFERILRTLLDEKIATRLKGDDGYVYKPVREETSRIKRIMCEGTLSKDPLWIRINELD